MNSRRRPTRFFTLRSNLIAALLGALAAVPPVLAQSSTTDITSRDSDGQTALHKYTLYDWGSLEDVKTLVNRGADVNAVDNSGFTPLHQAASYGFVDKAKFLLEKGARLDVVSKAGTTPLHLAAERRRHDPNLLALFIGPKEKSSVNLRDAEGRTALFRAADADNAENAKWLIDHGADPNIPTTRGEQPLDRALLLGYMKVARTLCENGGSPNAMSEDGMTVLVHTISRGKPEAVDFLLAQRFDPNAKCVRNRTALHMAASKADEKVAKALLAAGGNLNAADDDGRTPLDFVDETRNAAFAAWFKSQGAKPGVPKEKPREVVASDEDDGGTPLHRAVEQRDLTVLKNAIAANAKVINQPNQAGMTPLLKAIDDAWIAGADVLVAAGADVRVRSSTGRNLVFWAAGTGKLPVLQWVVEKGVPIEQPDNGGNSPIIRAAGVNLECVQWLVEQGAKINVRGKAGDTPLTQAIASDKLPIFKYLVEKGADLRGVDSTEATLLHRAARRKSPEYAQLLLDKGANVNAKDNRGLTPLHRAADTKSAIDTLKLLLQRGADRSAKDKEGKTPLDYATKYKNDAAIALLR